MLNTTSFFERFITKNRDYLDLRTLEINFVRSMTIAKYRWGYIIETEYIDDENVTTIEVLGSNDGKTAVLMSRERYGEAHNDMRSYPRDAAFPVGCKVNLIR